MRKVRPSYRRRSICTACLRGVAKFAAMTSAQAYPGAETVATEFSDYRPKIEGRSFNEVPFALTMLLATAAVRKLAESQTPVAPAARPEAGPAESIGAAPEPVPADRWQPDGSASFKSAEHGASSERKQTAEQRQPRGARARRRIVERVDAEQRIHDEGEL